MVFPLLEAVQEVADVELHSGFWSEGLQFAYPSLASARPRSPDSEPFPDLQFSVIMRARASIKMTRRQTSAGDLCSGRAALRLWVLLQQQVLLFPSPCTVLDPTLHSTRVSSRQIYSYHLRDQRTIVASSASSCGSIDCKLLSLAVPSLSVELRPSVVVKSVALPAYVTFLAAPYAASPLVVHIVD